MSTPPLVTEQLIDSLKKYIQLSGPKDKSIKVEAPFDGSKICDIPSGTKEDVEVITRKAALAQKKWRRLPAKERAQIFLRFHDLIFKNQNEILDLTQYETGKARKSAFEEVADVAVVSRYYSIRAEKWLRPIRRKGALPILTLTWEQYHPVGVVGIIAPWNYPLTLAITDAIPALLAGNAVVLKPASNTPLTALWIARLLDEAGLPENLFNVIPGPGREVGNAIIDFSDYVLFTGSTETGKSVAGKAGAKLTGHSMELGGKNPMLVLPDANISKTVDGAVRGCFANSGQLCISIERLYVHETIFNKFISAFAKRTRAMKLGTDYNYSTDMGSLISKEQLDTVESHVADAISKDATVLTGGKPRPELGPYFYEPTILTGVTDEMTIFDEETFGPVVSVYPFKNLAEVIDRMNDTSYGLNASVWTKNVSHGLDIARQIKAGTVNINEAYAATWGSVDSPMGGFKESGMGRRHGRQGFYKFTEPQTVSVQRVIPICAPPGVTERMWANFLTFALKLLKKVPGLR